MARFVMPDGRNTELLHVHDKGAGKPGCFCGSERCGNAGFCYDCYVQLPQDLTRLLWPKPQLINDYDFEGARAECRDYLKSIGVKDAEEEMYEDVITGLPAALQELLTGHVVEKTIEAPETDSVYANVFAGLPAELQKALLGE